MRRELSAKTREWRLWTRRIDAKTSSRLNDCDSDSEIMMGMHHSFRQNLLPFLVLFFFRLGWVLFLQCFGTSFVYLLNGRR